jgi:short-subunit dehydrogenase
MLLSCVGMIEEGFGHIVNISSIAGKTGSPVRSAYCSAKFAMFGLMDTVRYEVCTILYNNLLASTSPCVIQMLKSNVHVTNIAPGPVQTNVSKNALKGDGSAFGRTDHTIANGMAVRRCVSSFSTLSTSCLFLHRCVELTLIGVSNRQSEVRMHASFKL